MGDIFGMMKLFYILILLSAWQYAFVRIHRVVHERGEILLYINHALNLKIENEIIQWTNVFIKIPGSSTHLNQVYFYKCLFLYI